jgi:hypothetical protein
VSHSRHPSLAPRPPPPPPPPTLRRSPRIPPCPPRAPAPAVQDTTPRSAVKASLRPSRRAASTLCLRPLHCSNGLRRRRCLPCQTTCSARPSRTTATISASPTRREGTIGGCSSWVSGRDASKVGRVQRYFRRVLAAQDCWLGLWTSLERSRVPPFPAAPPTVH